ncbi:MAG: hypothetical protein ACFFDH_05300 [Promethearchaeota archaeon]
MGNKNGLSSIKKLFRNKYGYDISLTKYNIKQKVIHPKNASLNISKLKRKIDSEMKIYNLDDGWIKIYEESSNYLINIIRLFHNLDLCGKKVNLELFYEIFNLN